MFAPTVVVPQSFTEKKPSIVLDFGRVIITSDPHARDKAVEYKYATYFGIEFRRGKT